MFWGPTDAHLSDPIRLGAAAESSGYATRRDPFFAEERQPVADVRFTGSEWQVTGDWDVSEGSEAVVNTEWLRSAETV